MLTDPTVKYKARLETRLYPDREPILSGMISLSVKMGSAKVTVLAEDTTLFAGDRFDEVLLRFEASDAALKSVARVEIKDPKPAAQFQVTDLGNGTYAISFRDGQVDQRLTGKSVTLTLNLSLQGNGTAKANTTAKVKLSILK